MDASIFVPCEKEKTDIETLRNLFGIYYRTHNPILPEQIEDYALLHTIMDKLSQKRKNQLRRLIVEICDEYRQDAFLEGIQTGIWLMLEL